MRENAFTQAELCPEPQVEKHKIVSLFSGCGGMDLGFLGGFAFGGKFYDHLPFEIVWANEIDKLACDTYAANFGADALHRAPTKTKPFLIFGAKRSVVRSKAIGA